VIGAVEAAESSRAGVSLPASDTPVNSRQSSRTRLGREASAAFWICEGEAATEPNVMCGGYTDSALANPRGACTATSEQLTLIDHSCCCRSLTSIPRTNPSVTTRLDHAEHRLDRNTVALALTAAVAIRDLWGIRRAFSQGLSSGGCAETERYACGPLRWEGHGVRGSC
jgi:hypothetical protein